MNSTLHKLTKTSLCCGLSILLAAPACYAQTPDSWFAAGAAAIRQAKQTTLRPQRAKNVILFVGDGMGMSTITASRIREGQLRGQSGEENSLGFENFPHVALSKTYNTNAQVSDSAGTATAMVTGYKTKIGVLSLNDNSVYGTCDGTPANHVKTIVESAEEKGLATGVVTTTRITHATPAANYAHSPHRDWENDTLVPPEAKEKGCADIARQLIESPFGDGIDVVMGGGRRELLPANVIDVESGKPGLRGDGRDLIQEWLQRSPANRTYLWNQKGFDGLTPAKGKQVLALFNYDHMNFEADRSQDVAGEPSLAEMTTKAIELLAQQEKGYFLMVEGGSIDHAHHAGNSFRALQDTIAFSEAVKAALRKVNLDDTLVIVTADHSHVFTMAGYPQRGNPILGKVMEPTNDGTPAQVFAKDLIGLPYATLTYANGPGYNGPSDTQAEGLKTFPHKMKGAQLNGMGRPDLTEVDTESPQFLQEAMVALEDETHAGEDVPVFANGPRAHLLQGVIEQNVIYHLMVEAFGWSYTAR